MKVVTTFMSIEWKQIFFLFYFFCNIKQIRLPCLQAALQTDWFNEFFPLPPVEQGSGSPSSISQTHRMTPGKSLNLLPGFPHLPAGRGDSDSCQEPEFSSKAVPALHLSPGFPPPNPKVWPHQGSLEPLHNTAGDACSEKYKYQKT